ncbi:MAG: LemA family protein [Desulfobacterales bacterium]|nr:LemA family protein [Desulfobacterales bacterium]
MIYRSRGGQRVSRRISRIITQAYGSRYRLRPDEVIVPAAGEKFSLSPLGTPALFNRVIRPSRTKVIVTAALALLVFKAAITIYYFNTLVDMEQNMLAAKGDVQALMQRRNDIAVNLSKAVLDYSKHEQGVFTAIVSLRRFFTNGSQGSDILKQLEGFAPGQAEDLPSVPETGGLTAALSKLVAVAEQYPDLKLSANFETLMAALVQVELDLASQRIKFNQAANDYTTVTARFPGNFFHWVFGFDDTGYFEADDRAKAFKVIGY